MTDKPPTEPVQRLVGKYEQRISKLEETNGALCAEINRQERRIEELASENEKLKTLAVDMYESLWTVSESWAYGSYHGRMTALGLLGGDA